MVDHSIKNIPTNIKTSKGLNTKFQSIKGFYDILPEATPLWFKLEDTARRVLAQYGYQNIRMPLVEPTDLFVRSVDVYKRQVT